MIQDLKHFIIPRGKLNLPCLPKKSTLTSTQPSTFDNEQTDRCTNPAARFQSDKELSHQNINDHGFEMRNNQ